jgi:hypothetical protein
MRVPSWCLSVVGAAIATAEADPDGVLLAAVRRAVGERVPIAATLDLHGNVSAAMVGHADYLAAYLTNPHVDTHERGAECAHALLRMIGNGTRPYRAFVKLPFIPPSVTQNTKSGPYGDIIAFGQARVGPEVDNVSVLSGFTLGDTPKAGMSVVVSARTARCRAPDRARWPCARGARARYVPRLTSLADATRMAVDVGHNPKLLPLLFADVADNAGGGGRANTVWILEAFHRAGGCGTARSASSTIRTWPRRRMPRCRRESCMCSSSAKETHPLSGKFAADATVMQLHDGHFIGRRGIAAGRHRARPCARLRCDGIDVIVVSVRQQAKGSDIPRAWGRHRNPALPDHQIARSFSRGVRRVLSRRTHYRSRCAGADDARTEERAVSPSPGTLYPSTRLGFTAGRAADDRRAALDTASRPMSGAPAPTSSPPRCFAEREHARHKRDPDARSVRIALTDFFLRLRGGGDPSCPVQKRNIWRMLSAIIAADCQLASRHDPATRGAQTALAPLIHMLIRDFSSAMDSSLAYLSCAREPFYDEQVPSARLHHRQSGWGAKQRVAATPGPPSCGHKIAQSPTLHRRFLQLSRATNLPIIASATMTIVAHQRRKLSGRSISQFKWR